MKNSKNDLFFLVCLPLGSQLTLISYFGIFELLAMST